jgi:flagellar biosynthesis anti-sigma factor FlgM
MNNINQKISLGPNTTGQIERKNVRNDKTQDTNPTSDDVYLNKPEITGSQDAISLSDSVTETLHEAEFDHKKVEELRSAIARGAYPLDSMKIADKFIELEKLL